MKKSKWLVALLAIALVVGVVALVAVSCDGGGGGEEPETTAPEETTTTIDEGKSYNFLFSLGMPSSASGFNTCMLPWKLAIEAASNGRVTFDVKEANTLVKEDQQVDALLSGTSDICAWQPDWVPGVYPLVELSEYPGLFLTTDIAVKVTWQLIEEYGEGQFDGMHVLGLFFISPAQYGGVEQVHTLEDFAGVRLRSGGATETDVINALGGVPVESATGDLQTEIQKGKFDGMFLSWSFHAGNTNRWATNWTQCNLFVRPLVIAMNEDKWNSLPAAVQGFFNDNSTLEDWLKYAADDAQYNLDNTSLPANPDIPGLKDRGLDFRAIEERAADVGGEIYVLPADEQARWFAAMEPILQKWVDAYAGKLPAQEILDRAKELVAEYSGGATATTAAQ